MKKALELVATWLGLLGRMFSCCSSDGALMIERHLSTQHTRDNACRMKSSWLQFDNESQWNVDDRTAEARYDFLHLEQWYGPTRLGRFPLLYYEKRCWSSYITFNNFAFNITNFYAMFPVVMLDGTALHDPEVYNFTQSADGTADPCDDRNYAWDRKAGLREGRRIMLAHE
jgi:hypothetical protein